MNLKLNVIAVVVNSELMTDAVCRLAVSEFSSIFHSSKLTLRGTAVRGWAISGRPGISRAHSTILPSRGLVP